MRIRLFFIRKHPPILLFYFPMDQHQFRKLHILSLLKEYEEKPIPLDLHISNYFRSHPSLGSKDRKEIAETVYGIIRWQGLIDFIVHKRNWEERLALWHTQDFKENSKRTDLPPHIRVSFPKNLFEKILESHGKDLGEKICLESNEPAPTTVRINPLKTTREKMLNLWKEHYEVSPCTLSKLGIIFHKKINFFSLPEFKEGLFEVQDEGSQLLAELCQVTPGEQVMDYCSGSGGKTLAFAHRMENKGQIYLHDIRPHILKEAKKRLKRAGIQNGQIIEYDDPKLKKLKKKMDFLLVDAPCSGTGTLRRNPDMKWKFSEDMLKRLVSEQRIIFEKALSFLKSNGRIIYATCSILKQENEEQVAHFLKTYPLQLAGEMFKSLPEIGGMDGFFGAVFEKK